MGTYLLISSEFLSEAIRAETIQDRSEDAAIEPDTLGRVTVEAKFENLADLWAMQQGLKSADEVRAITIAAALVDAGVMLPSLPSSMIHQLGLTQSNTRRVRGSTGPVEIPMFEAVRLTIMGRECTMDVLEVPDGGMATIGRISLAHLNFVVDPRTQTLIGNPAHDGEHVLEM